MKGSKRERRPGVWELRIHIGQRRYRSATFRGSEAKANTALAAMVTDLSRKGVAKKGTLADLAERWFDMEADGWEATTRRNYRDHLDNRIIPDLGHLPLSKLDVPSLEQFYRRLSKDGLTAATVTRYHATLRSVLTAGVRWGELPHNPALLTRRPKARKFQPTIPTMELTLHLLERAAAQDGYFGAAVWVAAATGMRRGELCGLRWSRIEGDLLRVDTAVAICNRELIVKDPKSHQRRDITLDARTVAVLEAQQQRQQDRFPRIVKDPFVWSYAPKGRGATPPNPDWLTRRWTQLTKAEGVTGVRLHDMRHFMATALLSAGEPLAVVSKRLGHAQQSTTSNIYSHVLPGADTAAATRMGELMAGLSTDGV